MELDVSTNTYSNLTEYQVIEMPITVTPLTIILKTTAGGAVDICTYYRSDQDDDFTLCYDGSDSGAYARLVSSSGETYDSLLISCNGVSTSQPATLECIVMGVKV